MTEIETEIDASFLTAAFSFYEVGKGLAQIKDAGLYKDKYSSYESYLKERWNLTRARAYHLIYAAQVFDDLRSHFDSSQLPCNESLLRPLKALSSEERVKVWRKVLDGFESPRRIDVETIVKSLPQSA